MTASLPLVTCAIACFNARTTITRAVESALRQTWPNLEIVVADDASSDDSAALVEALAAKDQRLRLVRRPHNGGPGATRQTLLDAARGTFIVFLDDDDTSQPDRVRIQVDRLRRGETEAGGAPVLCYASGTRIYPNGHVLDLPAIGSRPRIPEGPAVADYLLWGGRRRGLFYGAGTPTCALAARTESLRAAGGFDPAFRRVEDAELAVRFALAGGRFVGCPERLFRQTATVADDKSAHRNYEAELQLVEKYRDYLLSRGRYAFARRWFTLRFHHFRGARLHALGMLLAAGVSAPGEVTRRLLGNIPRRLVHEFRARSRDS